MTADPARLAVATIFAQLFRDSPLPIAIYDPQGRLQHANEAHGAFAAAFGAVAGIGDTDALLGPSSACAAHRDQFSRALDGVQVDYPFELQSVADADEEPLSFRRFLLPATDDAGQVVGVVSVIVDVSDWLRAERDRARLQAELMKAQKIESLGMLAGGIAHDFNNLLMGVLGHASLLQERLAEGSDLRELVQAISLATQRAADLAQQLLAYAGKGRFQVATVDLSELARETADVLRIAVGGKSELALALAPNVLPVKGDVTQLRQVLMNLITNARDATEPGGVITIRTGQVVATPEELEGFSCEPDPSATELAFVEVEDTGVGMDAATIARIFDPLYSTKADGRGWGLSAVYGIVRGHRGGIRVASAPGQGTRIRVFFPLVDQLELPQAPAATAAPTQHAGDAGTHVLVVDDQEQLREVVSAMLQDIGYSVTVATSGAEALEVLSQATPSIGTVLLDLSMPGEDGVQTYARILQRHPGVKVVFMSGYEESAVPRADGFLQKPFTLSQLRNAIASACATQ